MFAHGCLGSLQTQELGPQKYRAPMVARVKIPSDNGCSGKKYRATMVARVKNTSARLCSRALIVQRDSCCEATLQGTPSLPSLQQNTLHHYITMVYVQWEICHELEKESINWEQVCLLFNLNQGLCSVRDEHDMFPLHCACYQNAPLWVIKFVIRINPEFFHERCPIIHSLSGVYSDWTTLELACDANAPLEVIDYLVESTRHVGDEVTHCRGSKVGKADICGACRGPQNPCPEGAESSDCTEQG